MKILAKLMVALAVLVGTSAGQNFWTDRAVGVSQFNGFSGLVPLQYAQVRVCDFSHPPLTQVSPCLPLATVYDTNGNLLPVVGGNFGQITTDIVGRFSFQGASGNYWIQVAATGSNTPQLSYPISIALSTNGLLSGINANVAQRNEAGDVANYTSQFYFPRTWSQTSTPPDNNYASRSWMEVLSGGVDAPGNKSQFGGHEATVVKRTIGQASGVHSTIGSFAEGDVNGFSTEVEVWGGCNVTGNECAEAYRGDIIQQNTQFSASNVSSVVGNIVTYNGSVLNENTKGESRPLIINTAGRVYSTGTISAISGTPVTVTGIGTAWLTLGNGPVTNLFFDMSACDAGIAYVVPIRSITDNTHLVLNYQAKGVDQPWACNAASGPIYRIYKGGTVTAVASGSFTVSPASDFLVGDIIIEPLAYNFVAQSIYNGSLTQLFPPIYPASLMELDNLSSTTYPVRRGIYIAGSGALQTGIDVSPVGGLTGDLLFTNFPVNGGMVMSNDTNSAAQTFLRALSHAAAVRNLVVYDRDGDQLSINGQSWSVINGAGNFASITPCTGCSVFNLYKRVVDTPGAITVNAGTCTDRGVALAGLGSAASIFVAANYALEANLALGSGQTVPGTAHYRICNPTAANITLAAGATFNVSAIQ